MIFYKKLYISPKIMRVLKKRSKLIRQYKEANKKNEKKRE